MTDQPIIIDAIVTPADPKAGQYQALVTALFNDNSLEDVFRFYDDELSFEPEEFIGLTLSQARGLFTKKDIAYLQAP